MYRVQKLNKRLHITDETGKSVYTPPSFVKVNDRKDLAMIADWFNHVGKYDIEPIIIFESKHQK